MMHIEMIQWSYYQMGSICQISAQIVVSAKNPIHRIASQVIVFMMGAFIFMLLDYYFQGQTYIIVYVGAIAIQFQFVIMMVHQPSGTGSVEKEGHLPSPVSSIRGETNETPCESPQYLSKKASIENHISSSTPNEDKNITKNVSNLNGQSQSSTINNLGVKGVKWIGVLISVISQILLPIYLAKHSIQIQPNTTSTANIPMDIYSYFYPIWSIEYLTITDIESQAILVYVAYPTAQIQISIALWTVMIGIISICSPRI